MTTLREEDKGVARAAKKTKEHVGMQSRSARETLETSKLLENEEERRGYERRVQYSTVQYSTV